MQLHMCVCMSFLGATPLAWQEKRHKTWKCPGVDCKWAPVMVLLQTLSAQKRFKRRSKGVQKGFASRSGAFGTVQYFPVVTIGSLETRTSATKIRSRHNFAYSLLFGVPIEEESRQSK